MTDKNGTSDSEDFYSADEEPKQFNVTARIRRRSSNEKRGKGRSPEQRKKDSSEQKIHNPEDSNVTNEVVNVKIGDDEERPIPPPRRKRKKTHPLLKQASAEEPFTDHKLSLNTDEKRRANTFSWPRGERPNVQYKDKENKEQSESDNSTPIHRDSQEGFESIKDTEVIVEELVKSKTRLSNSPSISIEPDTSLEFSNEMFDNSEEVESNDMFLSRAVGSNDTREGLVIYSDDESVDGDNLLCDSVDVVLQVPSEEEEEEEEEKEEEKVTDRTGEKDDSGPLPSDSQILEATYVKNLDTGEKFPLSLAEQRIPKSGKNPVDHQCLQRAKELSDSWEGGLGDELDGDNEMNEGASQRKPRKKRFVKKFFVKGRDRKHKGDGRSRGDNQSGSDEDPSPEHDQKTVKYKQASHNKGSLDFEKIRLKQDLTHTLGHESRAVWVIEFSICGRLLATAGQDSIVRVWVLRNAYSFFHELQVKYARMGVHSSADSLSEKSSVTSSHSSDPDEDPSTLKPFLEQSLCTYCGHSADVLDLSWSKNFFLLSSSMDKTVRLWHISRKECLCCFQHVDFVTAIAFHPRDDRYFLSGSLDGKLRLWNIPDKKVALWNEIEGVGSHLITAANFCMNGKLAVAGTYDGRCIFYETEHLKYHTQIHVRSRHGKNRGRKISGIEPLPGEDKILVTSNDSRLRLYNLRDHSLTCKYKGCLNSSSQIKATFSREGEYIVCGSEDNYIYVWKTHHDFNILSSVRRDRNDYYESFSAHSAPVTAVAFAPVPGITVDEGLRDIGEVVIAGDYQGRIKVYVNSDVL